MINGKDYGAVLQTLAVLGWLMIATLPAGAIAFLVWLVIVVVHRTSWRRKQRAI